MLENNPISHPRRLRSLSAGTGLIPWVKVQTTLQYLLSLSSCRSILSEHVKLTRVTTGCKQTADLIALARQARCVCADGNVSGNKCQTWVKTLIRHGDYRYYIEKEL